VLRFFIPVSGDSRIQKFKDSKIQSVAAAKIQLSEGIQALTAGKELKPWSCVAVFYSSVRRFKDSRIQRFKDSIRRGGKDSIV
jgi:hypothetical protein